MAANAQLAAARGGVGKAGVNKGENAWIDVQARTFTNWVNVQLEKVGGSISNLTDDVKSGVKLIQAVEVASKKSLGKYANPPKVKANELENCTLLFKFLKGEGINIVNIGPADINDGNLKLALGLIWSIIYHYQLSATVKGAGGQTSKTANAKDLLLEWVRAQIPEYDVKNFTTDWQDGRALCALVNALGGEPRLLPTHRQMTVGANGANLTNCKTGIDAAKEHLGVPRLIAAEDLSTVPDEHSVVTYISFFREAKRQDLGPRLPPQLENAADRAARTCNAKGCTKVRAPGHASHCPDHACMHGGQGACATLAAPSKQACPAHACAHGAGCPQAVVGSTRACGEHYCRTPGCPQATRPAQFFCETHACHTAGCQTPALAGKQYCEAHQCIQDGCLAAAVAGDKWCAQHSKVSPPAPAKPLPPPWERDANTWRKYEGANLGGRCKIRVYFSTTTSSQEIRKNTQALLALLERENVHKRPDFEPCIPVDVDMSKERRDAIFAKAKTKTTPLLFIDDEFVGDYAKVMELNESGKLHYLLQY